MSHAITLQLPTSLYDHFKRRAEQARRSLEAELLDAVRVMAAESEEQLPPDLENELAGLASLDDDGLWQAARNVLSREASAELEALNIKQKAEGLTDQERESLSELLFQYDRHMLLRAQAAALLKKRGYDVSGLLADR